jgi:molybdopterin synthase sulfur carrier subunit
VTTVRYFAAAQDAAGRESEPTDALTLGALKVALVKAHPGLGAILGRCALLVDGTRVDDDFALADALPGGRAIGLDLTLPDRKITLDGLDRLSTHDERLVSVGGGDHDHDGSVADLKPANPVTHRDRRLAADASRDSGLSDSAQDRLGVGV